MWEEGVELKTTAYGPNALTTRPLRRIAFSYLCKLPGGLNAPGCPIGNFVPQTKLIIPFVYGPLEAIWLCQGLVLFAFFLQFHTGDGVQGGALFQCAKCKRTFHSMEALENHDRRRRYACPECDAASCMCIRALFMTGSVSHYMCIYIGIPRARNIELRNDEL